VIFVQTEYLSRMVVRMNAGRLCKVAPVILNGVVSPDVSPEGAHLERFGSTGRVQGYLAHKKTRAHLGTPEDPRGLRFLMSEVSL
jgi:hypothetical protein